MYFELQLVSVPPPPQLPPLKKITEGKSFGAFAQQHSCLTDSRTPDL